MANANRCSAHREYMKPNTKVKTQRQKVLDDEYIDIAKIVKNATPKYDRKRDTISESQLKDSRPKD